MTQAELIRTLSVEASITQEQAKQVLDTLEGLLVSHVYIAGDTLSLTNVGTFKKTNYRAKNRS